MNYAIDSKPCIYLILKRCFQWREVGRELEGVIRIGAVNCGDEWMLCQHQGIRSYPTLIMYPAVSRLL